ncbi:winged helix-turn-helix transcriptional regulator [Sodalis sp. RH19]|uniref:winged helix-turn-helix transcriptional regulator n=1 Tax=Sodalis sp. RH19 TaxID=3394334 RepID=UPI0039B41051
MSRPAINTLAAACAVNTLAAVCTARPILDQIANKWSLMILIVLCEQPVRFNALQRRVGGITQKALTESLRRLERNGLVKRCVIASSPVAVEYSLTPLGHTLQSPFAAIYAWAVDHQPDIERAQRDFDQHIHQMNSAVN